jgi:hypothetical protein
MSRPIVVTAADRRYFRCLAQLLGSLRRHSVTGPGGRADLFVYDLGLDTIQRGWLPRRFPEVRLRRFPFERFAPHVALRPRAINTNAWKPIVLAELATEASGSLLWLDAATVACAPLDPIFAEIERTGLYTPFGGRASVAELTHPSTLQHMHATPSVAAQRQRASGVFGADLRVPTVRELIAAWSAHAQLADCIVPSGATLENHRFDQSLLNVLLYEALARGSFELTHDEIDVGSARPCPLYRTRNKLDPALPLAFDPLARAFFAVRRAADVAIIRAQQRLRGGRAAAPSAPAT